MTVIESTQNPVVRQVRNLHRRKGRLEAGAFLIETRRLFEDACAADWPLERVFATAAFFERHEFPRTVVVTPVHERVLAAMSTVETPEGLLAIARIPAAPPALRMGPSRAWVALEGIQDPGNLGTIWRSADAAGVDGLLLGPGTVDPWSPKVVRATMGACFRVPVRVAGDWLADLDELGRSADRVATTLDGSEALPEVDLCGPVVWLVGNEGAGLSDATIERATRRVHIPMRPGPESLNAAMATTICLYEMLRQRR